MTPDGAVPLSQVDLLVLKEVLLLGEALQALVALVWSLPSVDPLMPDQIGGMAESLPTVRAPKDPWAPARVHALVDDEGFLLGEALLTLAALVRLPLWVPRFAAVAADALHAPGAATCLVCGWGSFYLRVLLEALCGNVDLLVRLMDKDVLIFSGLTATQRAVILLLHHQHLLQTQALPTCNT